MGSNWTTGRKYEETFAKVELRPWEQSHRVVYLHGFQSG